MNKEHIEFASSRSSVNPEFLPYSTHRTAPYLLWDDAVSHESSSRTCCSCTCCRALTIGLIILLVSCVFAVVGVVIYLGIITNNNEDIILEEEILEGNMKVIEGDRYSSALQYKTSPEFNIKAQTYETLLNTVYRQSSLSDAFIRTEVTSFENGSLIVHFRLYLDRRKSPEYSMQKVYDVMREEVQQNSPLAFKTIRVDPATLNISGVSLAHKINFGDYFVSDDDSAEITDLEPISTDIAKETSTTTTSTTTIKTTTTPITASTTKIMQSHTTSNVLLSTFGMDKPPYMKHHQQATHRVDYGRWEPFTTESSSSPSLTLKPITQQAPNRGSVSEISFDWEPDEGIAAFFPTTSVSPPRRVGIGVTFKDGSDKGQEFRSRDGSNEDDVVIRMDSPSLTINKPKGIGSISPEWVPLAPIGRKEPTSKELLADRDDPKLGFGLRVSSTESPTHNSTVRNIGLKNQSSHAVIERLPPGIHPRRNNSSRISSVLQRRQEEWQRVREGRLHNMKGDDDFASSTTTIKPVSPTDSVQNARSLPSVIASNNNIRDSEPKARHGVRDTRERKHLKSNGEMRYSVVTSVSMETASGNRTTTQSPVDMVTITRVVTSMGEETKFVTPTLISFRTTTGFGNVSSLKKQKSLFTQQSLASLKLNAVPENVVKYISKDIENTSTQKEGTAFNDLNIERNKSANKNSLFLNDYENYSEESGDDDRANILLSTEIEANTKKSIAQITDKSATTTKINKCNDSTFFLCRSGECISIINRCNRVKDCSDNSDEVGCTCADFVRKNIINSTLCDGIVDCWDYSDENQCEWCSPDMFICPNSAMCINKVNVCDGIADCPNGDDEKRCVTIAPNISLADKGSYWSSGLVLVRKEGKWGKLCMQDFDTFVSQAQIGLGDLTRVVCQTIGFNDFEEGREFQETFIKMISEKVYFEPQYNNISSNSKSVAIDFSPTRCESRKVISVRCKEFSCGRRHQFVKSRARIVGGINSVPGSWPWQAAVYKEGNFMCGATLISSQYLLSAAHCFYLAVDHYWIVRLGVLRRASYSPFEQIRRISHIIIHPNYVANNFINDIVLLRMEKPIQFSDHIRPICLPTVDETQASISNQQRCTVVGWGQVDEDGDYLPDTLQEVRLPLISAINCRTYTTALASYARVNHNMFCAGVERGGRDACLGDSGGPLMCQQSDGRWTLTGITSNGFGCARPSRPGIYTKVVNYRGWITKIISNSLPQPLISSCTGIRCPLGKCLNGKQICDGFVDCIDGSDENHCIWPDINSSLNRRI